MMVLIKVIVTKLLQFLEKLIWQIKIGHQHNLSLRLYIIQNFFIAYDVFQFLYFRLSFETKGVIQSLGSTQIFALDYREMWVFVGQKGIDGTSPYEKVGAKQPSSWGAKVDIIECIPKTSKLLCSI